MKTSLLLSYQMENFHTSLTYQGMYLYYTCQLQVKFEDCQISSLFMQISTFKFSFSEFYPFIIGKEGSTKKRIESETKTIIVIPKFGQKGNISERF